jgi:DNA-binding NarL/FixJ family response regulator
MKPETQLVTRVLVVDDHPIVRLGIRQMIEAEPGFSLCAETDCAEEALQLARHSKPDVAIVDLSLGRHTGLELIRHLHEAQRDLPVLVLSMHDEALFAERVLRAGARGYIMKHEAIDGLIGAIQRVVTGRIYVSERIAQAVLERLGNDEVELGGVGTLTDRELAVFDLIGGGQSTATIADALHVSIKTVETYRSNIKTKLHLKDAAELIRFATMWSMRM